MSTKNAKRRDGILVLAIALALLVTPALAQAAPAGGGTEYALTYGWYQERSTFYYSFDNDVPSSDGGVTVTPAPIYVFFYGDDTPVPGQHNVVDVVPGDAGYSDLWQVHKVTVPDNYVADSVRSYADIVTNGYTVTPVDVFVNCPIVPDGSTLQYSQQGLTQGWDDNSAVYYFDFGMNPVETAPIYVLFYGDDTPVPDQRNIIDDIPGDADYSAFWRVHKVTVPDDYVANSARSLDDITTAGYTITPTSILVNCPVVRTEGAPEMFDLTSGWFRHGQVDYYSFANPIPNTESAPEGGPMVVPAPIYVLFYGDGTPVAGQHNIVDVVPGDPGYSDLWQVHKVTVPDAYVADTVRSYAQIVDAGYPIDVLDVFVNCPVVPEGSSLADPSDANYVQGWYRGQTVFYFDFGMNPTTTAPIYVLFYGDGTPVPGQHNIVDTVPGQPDYSAFWQVHQVTVPDDYVADSATSLSDLQAASYPITPTSILVNCPIVMQPTADDVAEFTAEQAGGGANAAAAAGLAGAGLLLLAGMVLYRRRQHIGSQTG
ncbi:MAG: hypothetical protein R2844_19735 [Caldilineales bacterium]